MKLNPLTWFRNSTTYSVSDDAVLQAFYGAVSSMSASGIRVTKETAMRSAAVLACIIVRSETHSSLPVNVLRRSGDARASLTDHPAYRLLAIAPNELMHSGEFWRWEDQREDIFGEAHARIVWRGYDALEIWPLIGEAPRLVYDKNTGKAAYEYKGDTYTPANAYSTRDILHFKGPVLESPTKGRSLIDLASETIGTALASEQFFARLLGNGNHFPGWLEAQNALEPKDIQAVQDQLKGFAGVIQAGVIRIFDRGLQYKSNPMSIKDADLTSQMRWQLERICSVFRVPLAMVQDLTHGTYTNSEQQDLWLAKHTATPMCVNKERVLRKTLFASEPDVYAKFSLTGLLRGDFKTRMEGYAAATGAPFMTRADVRRLEDWDPVEGFEQPLVPLNMGASMPDGHIEKAHDSSGASDPDGSTYAMFAPIIKDATDHIRRRVEHDRSHGRSVTESVAFAEMKLAPIAEAFAAAGLAFDAESFTAEVLGDAGLSMPTKE